MFRSDQLQQLAKSTLKDETATDIDKAAAKKAISRINNQAEITKGRPKRPKRKDYESDEAHNQALFEFRSFLDRGAVVREASKVLDDPASSVYLRRKARETLYGPDPEPAEPIKTAESEVPGKPPRSRLSTTELAEEQELAQAFLDSIGTDSIRDDAPVRPVPQSATPKASTAPPINPRLYCEQCRVPFKVCGCDKVMCSLCLRPQSDCFPPCQNSRRRF
jgi:hypothetical protein